MSVAPGHQGLILMYHRIVGAERDPWGMCVSPENFDAQLGVLDRLGVPMSLPDYVAAKAAGKLPPRSVVVTFDDGYLDNLENALPLLERHRVPATIYVTTGNVGSNDEFWWDWLEAMLLQPRQLPPRLHLDLPSGEADWILGDAASYGDQARASDRGVMAWRAAPGSRLRFFYEVWLRLWPLDPGPRRRALEQVAAWCGMHEPPSAPRRTMTARELARIGASPLVTIGAHTVNHPPLPAHPAEVQAREIGDCQLELQAILGQPVTAFAYPHGELNETTVQLLHSAGFHSAVTIEQKLAAADTDPMRLPRYGVDDTGAEEFLARFSGLFVEGQGFGA